MEAAAAAPPRPLAWVALALVAAAFALALAGVDRTTSATGAAQLTPVIVGSDSGSRQAIVRALVIAAGPGGTPGYLGSSVRERRRMAAASAAWTGGRSFRGEP